VVVKKTGVEHGSNQTPAQLKNLQLAGLLANRYSIQGLQVFFPAAKNISYFVISLIFLYCKKPLLPLLPCLLIASCCLKAFSMIQGFF
jgi:hypothetical protein